MFADYKESGPALLGNKERSIRGMFRLSNTNVTVANTIRRAICVNTPSVGFRTEPYNKSDVAISVNTTPLVNEMIAHRIGMIPVRVADLSSYDPTKYEFVLDKENDTKEIIDVHASDFKVFMTNPDNPLAEPVQLPTEEFFPPDPITGSTVLITRLRPQWNPAAPNERISLKAKSSISNGAENIRWSPISQCSYEYTRDMDDTHQMSVFHSWLATAKKINDSSTLLPDRLDELNREFQTMEVQRCYLKDEKGEPNDFTFYIESVGIQTVPEIVYRGIESCEALVSKYIDMDQVTPENVQIRPGDCRFQAMDIIFTNETHTLGNLLETYLVSDHVDTDSALKLTYAGYKVPHPLRPEMYVRIGLGDAGMDHDTQVRTAQLAVATVCRKLKEEFNKLKLAWNELHMKAT